MNTKYPTASKATTDVYFKESKFLAYERGPAISLYQLAFQLILTTNHKVSTYIGTKTQNVLVVETPSGTPRDVRICGMRSAIIIK